MPNHRTADSSARETRVSRPTVVALLSVLFGLTASLTTSGCGLFPPDRYTIRVDSLTVTPGAVAGEVSIRAHGIAGSDGCGRLERVERDARGDTLIRRFVGEQRHGNCIQMPTQLEYTEAVTVPPGRTVRYVVRQPDGAPLIRDLAP